MGRWDGRGRPRGDGEADRMLIKRRTEKWESPKHTKTPRHHSSETMGTPGYKSKGGVNGNGDGKGPQQTVSRRRFDWQQHRPSTQTFVQNPVLILLNVPSKAHENTTHFAIVTKVDVDRIDLCIHRQTGQIKLHK